MIGLELPLTVAYVLVSARTIKFAGSAIVILALFDELELSNSANLAAVTVMETEPVKSSKNEGAATEIVGFVPKFDPKLKDVLLVVEPVVVAEYILLLVIESELKLAIFESLLIVVSTSLPPFEVSIKPELKLVKPGSLKNSMEFVCNQL